MNLTFGLLLIPIAYLIGSISFAVVVSKCMRLPDPHSYGSGNPGATNVLRTGNKLAALLTLFGDALKGYLAVMLARLLVGDESLTSTLNSWLLCVVAVAVFLGPLFPIFHGFEGGNGVAAVDLEGDRLAREGLHEDLHAFQRAAALVHLKYSPSPHTPHPLVYALICALVYALVCGWAMGMPWVGYGWAMGLATGEQ